MADLKPITAPSVQIADASGRPTQPWFEYFKNIDAAFRALLANFNSFVDGSGVYLTTSGHQNLTGGFTQTEFDIGTPTNGSTTTVNPSDGLKQKLTNNVASLTIAATSECGDVELRVVNGASAGTISFTGFDKKWSSDPLDTTNAHEFVIFIYGFAAKKAYLIKALQ